MYVQYVVQHHNSLPSSFSLTVFPCFQDEKLKVLGRNKGTKMADKTKAESKVRSLTKEISNLEKEKKLLEDRIASILEQNSKDFSDEKRQREEQIQGLEIQMAEIKVG